jgi:ParB-like chromosome segregation protein Spo0J
MPKPKLAPAKAGGMSVESWPIGKPVPYARNPRKNAQAIDKVAASLKEFGWKQPIVVDTEGVVVVGHTRLLAAQKLGLAEVPVLVAGDLTATQIKAYRLADNRTNEEAEWDNELLALELADLNIEDFDLALTGFDLDELVAIDAKANATTEGLTDPDEIPEAPADPISQPGDLWLLGKHRLLCGDSTSVDAVQRLMASEKAGLMNTDPPYGIDYNSAELHEHGVTYAKIANDQHKDEDLQEFLEEVFGTALTVLRPNAAWYLWHAMLTQGFFAAAKVILHRQIIWVKPILVFGRGQYHWKHELCFMGWVKGHVRERRSGHRPAVFGSSFDQAIRNHLGESAAGAHDCSVLITLINSSKGPAAAAVVEILQKAVARATSCVRFNRIATVLLE